jgi:hypothetical protein
MAVYMQQFSKPDQANPQAHTVIEAEHGSHGIRAGSEQTDRACSVSSPRESDAHTEQADESILSYSPSQDEDSEDRHLGQGSQLKRRPLEDITDDRAGKRRKTHGEF